jgi:hypothetical protein
MVNHGQSHWIIVKWIFQLSERHNGFWFMFQKKHQDVIMGKVPFDEDVNQS